MLTFGVDLFLESETGQGRGRGWQLSKSALRHCGQWCTFLTIRRGCHRRPGRSTSRSHVVRPGGCERRRRVARSFALSRYQAWLVPFLSWTLEGGVTLSRVLQALYTCNHVLIANQHNRSDLPPG